MSKIECYNTNIHARDARSGQRYCNPEQRSPSEDTSRSDSLLSGSILDCRVTSTQEFMLRIYAILPYMHYIKSFGSSPPEYGVTFCLILHLASLFDKSFSKA